MEKKCFIAITFLFFFLTSLEMGIFIEVLWHGWGGYGNISKEYTDTGGIGIAFLIFSIPVSVIVILLIRITLYIKKSSNIKVFFARLYWCFSWHRYQYWALLQSAFYCKY